MSKTFAQLVDEVIENARTAQAETGPDPDYRKAAEGELAQSREQLLKSIEQMRQTILVAWDALPGGRDYPVRAVEKWLMDDMRPAIAKLRRLK